jgi:23S rRNA (cytidine2498-2'-O)-methyltransferase
VGEIADTDGEPASIPATTPAFLFVTCQVGAETALKGELARVQPGFHFAYSRPGFLTFKLPAGQLPAADFVLQSVFARAWGFTLGKVKAESLDQAAAAVWQTVGAEQFQALHVWQRDMAAIGQRSFEPHVTPAALAAEDAIRRYAESCSLNAPLARIAAPGQRVLDCVLVEPHEWWIGWHLATSGDSCHPGGLRQINVPEGIVSRAYVKLQEALAWSALPIEAGQVCVEIGCSPGGASQALLEHGLTVVGIDPAEVDASVLANPNFTHVKKRGADVRRREFRGVNWLAADMNVAPDYTLDTVEAIVTHEAVNIRGLLLTLKLLDWKLADQIPAYLARVRGWGYKQIAARQLAHNRQEICVTALRGEKRKK